MSVLRWLRGDTNIKKSLSRLKIDNQELSLLIEI